jgi:hypothetical protein
MRVVFVMKMFLREIYNCASPNTPRRNPLCSFVVGCSSKIYFDGQKQKKRVKKLCP